MNSANILLVEDEMIIYENLRDSLETLGYNVSEPAITYREAIEKLENESIDLAIIDIRLAGKRTGIDVANVIKDQYDFPFIFLSSNSDIITLKAVEKVNPHAFLIKPYKIEDVHVAIELALAKYNKEQQLIKNHKKDFIFVKQKDKFVRINFDEIAFIKSENVYLDIFLTNKTRITIRGNLGEYQENYSNRFIRCHRGYIVNVNHISSFNSSDVQVIDEIIPVGTKYYPELVSRLSQY